jgi:flagellar motor switch protein FliN/FliY
MKTALDPITEAAVSAARASLPEFVTVGSATMLPRGADPFTGGEYPTLVAATRWVNVAPGGVLIGGQPEVMSTVLGFDLPAVPEPVSAENRKPDDPPAPKWADLVTEAARPVVTTVTQAIATSVAGLAGLPPECSPTQVSMNNNEAQLRAEVGSVSDAVVVLLSAEDQDVRLVVVVPGIFVARMHAKDANGGAPAPVEEIDDEDSPDAGPKVRPQFDPGVLDGALASVPMDLSIELGRARVPLSHVLHLHEGEVLELQEGIDAPVELVAGSTAVARGDLEVSEAGNIVLHVTSIPGRDIAPRPRVMNGRATDQPEADAAAEREPGDHESLAEAPDDSGDA